MNVTAVPLDWVIFGAVLAGVAMYHRHSLAIALSGAAVSMLCYAHLHRFAELSAHLTAEGVALANLSLLLVGCALLEQHFQLSGIPQRLSRALPSGWRGAFGLVALTFVLSGFLDNIAAALIGAALAQARYGNRIHLAYIGALIMAANAGGAGSVIGDTTTTMMWIKGISADRLLPAYLGSFMALLIAGGVAARIQDRYAPAIPSEPGSVRVDWIRVGIVALMLLSAVGANVAAAALNGSLANRFPVIGLALWVPLLGLAPLRRPAWDRVPEAVRGASFLSALVIIASLLAITQLPNPSGSSTLGIGFVSAVFDNIPLTALALRQGGYDWALLAYAVGVGGSLLWFGSSAGVAITAVFPEARLMSAWWRVSGLLAVAYLAGFAAMLYLSGWHAGTPH
jgi:Na+/H+ antiporter NhaD/arsenite permease-like protein